MEALLKRLREIRKDMNSMVKHEAAKKKRFVGAVGHANML